MDNCQDRPTFFPEAVWKALMNFPALRYMKAPVDRVEHLYRDYPSGNEKGAFAFVHDENTFYTYHPRGWNRGKWKPIAGGLESFFEIDAEFLKEGDILVYDSNKKRFVVKSGNVWNNLLDKASSIIQTNRFLNEVKDIPTIDSDAGVYFVHENEEAENGVIEFRALYVVIDTLVAKKVVKIWNSKNYYTATETQSKLDKKANQTQVDDIAASVDVLSVTKADKSVVDALQNGIIKQDAVDTYNDTSGGKTSLLNKYPNPQVGWDVYVRNENTRYNWNGTKWVNMETGVYGEETLLQYIKKDSILGEIDILSSDPINTKALYSNRNILSDLKWTFGYFDLDGNIIDQDKPFWQHTLLYKVTKGTIVVAKVYGSRETPSIVILDESNNFIGGYGLASVTGVLEQHVVEILNDGWISIQNRYNSNLVDKPEFVALIDKEKPLFLESVEFEKLAPYLPKTIGTVKEIYGSELQQGGLTVTGDNIDSNIRIRTGYIDVSKNGFLINIDSDYVFDVHFFDGVGQFLGHIGGWSNDGLNNSNSYLAKYIRLNIKKRDDSTISPENISLTISIQDKYDKIASSQLLNPLLDTQRIFDKGYVISDWESGELCAHSSVLYPDNEKSGDMYLVYNPNNISPQENIKNTQLAITYFNTLNKDRVTKINVIENGTTIGDFTQRTGGYSPYEPHVLFNDKDTFNMYFTANNLHDEEGIRQVYMVFDKKAKRFEQEVKDVYIKYGDNTLLFTHRNMTAIHNAITGESIPNNAFDLSVFEAMTRFVEYKGWMYGCFAYAEVLSSAKIVTAYIARTQDGINFEIVSNPHIPNSVYPEGSIEIIGDELFLMLRGITNYTICKYNLVTNLWDSIQTHPGDSDDSMGRPWLIQYKGKLIAICNSISNQYYWTIDNNKYRSWRSGVSIYDVDPRTLSTSLIKQVTNKYGCHYYSIVQDIMGDWYMSYSEDRRQLSNFPHNNNRSNIGMVRFEDIIGY